MTLLSGCWKLQDLVIRVYFFIAVYFRCVGKAVYFHNVDDCLLLPLSVDRRWAMNFAPTSLDDDFLPSEKASRLPLGVKVSNGIL